MKKNIIFFLFLTISIVSFSQQTTPTPAFTKQDYLKKSESQKFTAWVLLGGGGAVLTITALSNLGVCIGPGCTKQSFPIVPVGIGVVCMAGSIPFFIASAKNKRKAISMSFKNEKVPQLQKSSFVYKTIPSLTLKICL